jgi:hypothetical protein
VQEVEHQKQALQATQGAITERSQRITLTTILRSWRLCGEFVSFRMDCMVSRFGEVVQAAAAPYPVRSGNALTACAGRDNHQSRAHDLRKVIE